MNLTKSSRTRKVVMALIVFVFLLTIAATFFAFTYFRTQKITSLEQRVTSFAVALDGKAVSELSGSEMDLYNPSYIELKERIMRLQEFNADTRFIYLMGVRDGEVFFYADSEDSNSEDYSPPGQVYDEASDVMYSVFSDQTIGTEVSSDRWGTWLSVMAPVVDPFTNETVALVGFDMPYQSFLTEVILFTSLPATIGLIILILLIATFIYAKKDEGMLQLRSEYFAIAAHDLRTPLTGIKWAMDSLKKIKALPAEQKYAALVDQINISTENMLLSVNELLDGSSVEKSGGTKLVRSKTNLSELLQNAFSPLEIYAKEKNLKVIWQVNKDLTVNGDSDKLRRVFANLLSNAIKYSKEKGTIKITGKKIGGQAVVSTKDSGIGIPVKDQANVFNGYFRASNAKEHTTQGTGLGLYYVKNVVEKHGGNIAMISVPDKGTEITLSFPIN